MLTVDDYAKIRLAHRDGMSIREIARTFDHAPVLRDWRLPESFLRLRQALEKRHGPPAGARHYVRVLQLLAEHPPERVEQAARACLRRGELSAERVGAEARRLGGAAAAPPVTRARRRPACPWTWPPAGRASGWSSWWSRGGSRTRRSSELRGRVGTDDTSPGGERARKKQGPL
jgi:hypothetical protein